MRKAKFLLLFLIFMGNVSAQTMLSREGFQQITWQDSFANFSHLVLVQGSESYVYPLMPKQNLTISGLPDGEYAFFGKNQSTGEMQEIALQLNVQHYPLATAFSLFALGLVVFTYLIAVMRHHSNSELLGK